MQYTKLRNIKKISIVIISKKTAKFAFDINSYNDMEKESLFKGI